MPELRFSKAELTETQERDFQKWIRSTKWFSDFVKEYGDQPDIETPLYDYRRAWLDGIKPDQDGHWPTFTSSGELLKAPNHPTFHKAFEQNNMEQKQQLGVSEEKKIKLIPIEGYGEVPFPVDATNDEILEVANELDRRAAENKTGLPVNLSPGQKFKLGFATNPRAELAATEGAQFGQEGMLEKAVEAPLSAVGPAVEAVPQIMAGIATAGVTGNPWLAGLAGTLFGGGGRFLRQRFGEEVLGLPEADLTETLKSVGTGMENAAEAELLGIGAQKAVTKVTPKVSKGIQAIRDWRATRQQRNITTEGQEVVDFIESVGMKGKITPTRRQVTGGRLNETLENLGEADLFQILKRNREKNTALLGEVAENTLKSGTVPEMAERLPLIENQFKKPAVMYRERMISSGGQQKIPMQTQTARELLDYISTNGRAAMRREPSVAKSLQNLQATLDYLDQVKSKSKIVTLTAEDIVHLRTAARETASNFINAQSGRELAIPGYEMFEEMGTALQNNLSGRALSDYVNSNKYFRSYYSLMEASDFIEKTNSLSGLASRWTRTSKGIKELESLKGALSQEFKKFETATGYTPYDFLVKMPVEEKILRLSTDTATGQLSAKQLRQQLSQFQKTGLEQIIGKEEAKFFSNLSTTLSKIQQEATGIGEFAVQLRAISGAVGAASAVGGLFLGQNDLPYAGEALAFGGVLLLGPAALALAAKRPLIGRTVIQAMQTPAGTKEATVIVSRLKNMLDAEMSKIDRAKQQQTQGQ